MRVIVTPNSDQEKKKKSGILLQQSSKTLFFPFFSRHKVESNRTGPRWGLPSHCHSIHFEPSVESVGIFVNDVG